MALTAGNIILLIVLAILGIGVTIVCFVTEHKMGGVIAIFMTIIVFCGTMFGLSWWHKNTAEGARAMKDYESNFNNGLMREITITSEDGREIFHYEGKVDIETKHEGNGNYILFESEEGLRYIIYYGVMDTVVIKEKNG